MSGTFQGRIAFASIKFTAGVPSFLSQSGDFDATITDNGVGAIALTLQNPIDPAEAIYIGSTRSTSGPGAVNFSLVTDTSVELEISDFTAAADLDCDICILVKPTQ